jgi:hypothetical protein
MVIAAADAAHLWAAFSICSSAAQYNSGSRLLSRISSSVSSAATRSAAARARSRQTSAIPPHCVPYVQNSVVNDWLPVARRVVEAHGWGDLQQQLSRIRPGRFDHEQIVVSLEYESRSIHR